MSRDLEETLDEMGLEYRAVVMRLRAAREAARRKRERGTGNRGWLVAASLLLFVGLGVFFAIPQPRNPATPRHSHGAPEYRASVGEMIATQNPDGSWKNDFLTRRNAAALKVCGDPAARIAYKKAMRYLSFKGLLSTKG